MAMEGLDSLSIPEDKKKYIMSSLNPILEEMVADCISRLPGDVLGFMVEWLENKRAAKEDEKLSPEEKEKLSSEVEALKSELSKAKLQLQDAAKMHMHDKPVDQAEESEEEEDDAEDELPAEFLKPRSQMAGARASVSAEAYGAWNEKKAFVPPVNSKTAEQQERLKAVLSRSFMFKALEDQDMATVVGAMKEVSCDPNHRVIEQGEDGNFLFVIESGTFQCLIKKGDAEEVPVKTCEAGDVFGELALLYNCPRAASVMATTQGICWQLDRETFNYIVKESAVRQREAYESFLAKVPLLANIDAYERSQLADALTAQKFPGGANIVQQGSVGDTFYIIESGEAAAVKDGTEVMQYKAGDYFGELALLRNQPRAATVKAKTEVKALSLEARSFKRLLAVNDILERAFSIGATKYS